jgi:hypothetical protein
VVHALAGARVHSSHDRDRSARFLRARPLPLQGARSRRRARRRPVRIADRRRRARLPSDPAGAARAWLGAGPRCARVLQRRGRRADRRHVLVEPRPAGHRGSRHARRPTGRTVPGDHAAPSRSRRSGSC